MLTELRQHSKSFLVYLLFGMIIVVFVFTFNTGMGGGDGGCGQAEVPTFSKVQGDAITQETLVMSMRALPRLLAKAGGEGLIRAAGVDSAALSAADSENLSPAQAEAHLQLIELVYIASAIAEDMGLRITDEELKDAIYGDFYKKDEKEAEDGIPTNRLVFDREGFDNYVNYGLHTSEADYQQFTRKALLAVKLYKTLEDSSVENTMEVELLTRAYETKVSLQFVEFDPKAFEGSEEPSADEVKAFAASHAEEIGAWYDSHPADFHAEAGVKMSALLVKDNLTSVPEGKTARDVTRETATKMLARLDGTEKLFPNGVPITIEPPKDGGTINLNPADFNQEEPKDLPERFKLLARHESQYEAGTGTKGLFPGWQSEKDLTLLLGDAKVAQQVLASEAGKVTSPLESSAGVWLVFVEEVRTSRDLTVEAATPEIAALLLKKKNSQEKAMAVAEQFKKAVQASETHDMEAALKEMATQEDLKAALEDVTVDNTGEYSLVTQSVPKLGSVKDLFDESFQMKTDAPVSDKIYINQDNDGCVVVVLKDRIVPKEVTDQQKEMSEFSLNMMRQIRYVPELLVDLRVRAVEKGDVTRTEEYQNFLSALALQEQQRLQKEMEKAGFKPMAQK